MSSGTILVTGATGNIGAKLSAKLLEKGKKVRALGRDGGKLKGLKEKGAEVVVADLLDKAAVAKALAGAEGVFAMIPPKYDAPDFRGYQNKASESLAEGIRAAGVKNVVHLSSLGAEHKDGVGLINGLFDSEARFNALPGGVTHLRPGYFMENFFSAIGLIKGKGINGGGLKADLPIAFIATQDIAAAAAEALSGPAPADKSVRELLGPADRTMVEATKVLGAAVGKKDLAYVQFPLPDFEKALLGLGFSADVARLFVEMVEGHNAGRVHGRRTPATTTPTTLEQFAPVFAAAYNR
jgi:uncharacterized protein YbjT (DUF2867 family)